jgi:DNA-binding NarL/FixJ family response regulator
MVLVPAPGVQAPCIRVALVDDDPHFRLYLSSVFGASPRHELRATAESAEEALAWPAGAGLHVVLLDIGLPGRSGTELVSDLLNRHPDALVIMLTASSDDDAVLASIQRGAVGYVLKGGVEADITGAIDEALAGGAPMSPAIARKVLGLMRAAPAAKASPGKELATLTPRETEVLERVATGASDKEVAAQLGLARSTVKNVLLSVYGKWRVCSRTEAAVKFVRAAAGGGRR